MDARFFPGTPFALLIATASNLLSRDWCVHDRRGCAIHVILVAFQAVLTGLAAGVAGLAELLLRRAEAGHEILWIALLVALEIRTPVFKAMACQATSIVHNAHVRLMNEIREAPSFALD